MVRKMDNKYTAKEAAAFLGVSTRTLRRKNSSGELVAKRDSGNHPYYFKEQLEKYNDKKKKYRILWSSKLYKFDSSNLPKDNLVSLSLVKSDLDLDKDPSFKKIVRLSMCKRLKQIVVPNYRLVGTKDEYQLFCRIFKTIGIDVVINK